MAEKISPISDDLKTITTIGLKGNEINLFVPLTPRGQEIIKEMSEAGEIDTSHSFGDIRNNLDKK